MRIGRTRHRDPAPREPPLRPRGAQCTIVATRRAGSYRPAMDLLWLPGAFAALHAAVVVGVAARVVMVCPHTGSALAWIMMVAAMPLVGIVLYVSFGERRIGHLRRARLQALAQ